MNIKLYQNSSEVNRVTKSDYLTLKYNLDGNLRAECNLLDPVIEVSSDTPLFDINYCYIEDFNRYYFVDNVDIVITGLYRLKLSVDVLFTYSSELRSLNAFVTRNEYEYNLLITDDKIPFKTTNKVELLQTSEWFPHLSEIEHDKDNYCILVVSQSTEVFQSATDLGGFLTNNFLIDYLPNKNVASVNLDIGTLSNAVLVTNYSGLFNLYYLLYQNSNYNDYLMGIYRLPYKIPTDKLPFGYHQYYDETEESPRINCNPTPYFYFGSYKKRGTADYNNCNLYYYCTNNYSESIGEQNKNALEYLLFKEFNISFEVTNNSLNYQPFKYYYMYIPFVGEVQLDLTELLYTESDNERKYNISIKYINNVIDGTSNCVIRSYVDEEYKIYRTISCNLMYSISFTKTNHQTVVDNRLKAYLGLGISLISSATSLAVGGVTNRLALGVGNAVSSAVSGIGNVIGTELTQHERGVTNIPTGQTDILIENYFYLYTRNNELTVEDFTHFNKLYGRPLNETKLLSDLTGYTEIGEIHLENLNATKEEITRLQNILNSGGIIL